jgi:site-specific DNA recombinase
VIAMHHVPNATNGQIRCVIYSRFSADQQNARSAADQTAACRKYAESQGWTVVEVFEDLAMSGASSFRPAYQRMQALAQQRGFDVLLAEGLDRLNRHLANGAQLYDLLTFLNIRIYTLQDGLIQPLQVGIMGTMSQIFLNELRHKTRRVYRDNQDAMSASIRMRVRGWILG